MQHTSPQRILGVRLLGLPLPALWAVVMVVLLAGGRGATGQPLITEQLVITTSGGTARGWFAAVSLTDPTVELVVTGAANAGAGADSILTRTDTWRAAVGAKLAVNANFFSTVTGTTADAVGLVVSNGTLVSDVRTYNGNPDPALVFDKYKRGRIGNIGAGDLAGVFNGVAGVGPSTSDADPGTWLVTDGVNTGATARVSPATRTARTALGLNRAGTTLLIVVIDGPQTNWSVGMTLSELGSYILSRGAYRAINMDGGGSSSFVYLNNSGTVQTNRPQDGTMRAVSTQLGIKLNTTTIPDRTTRPIRGAWLRPPTTIASLESTVSQLAAAGIQDLFLETVYWGQDTAATGVLPSRFGYDYLAQAIPACAKYGVRVHAWCETGYFDFGTNPSALLAANPGWVVKHRDTTNTSTGDQANQRFVNLGNPGVRALWQSYFTALATNYPGLEGAQADYHFFPLSGSGTAPWSFDTWARSAYQAQYGADPITIVGAGGASPPANWLTFNRTNVADALRLFRDAARNAQPTLPFSAVAFADWSGTTHTSKMIDLPQWTNKDGADLYFVMSYFSAASSIDTDLGRAQTAIPGRRIVAGLANLTSGTRPDVTTQLTTAKGRLIEDFSWFDAPTFINNPSMMTMLRNFIDTSATPQRGDINRDGFVDARDIRAFDTLFTGTPIATTAGTIRYDLNGDGVIDGADRVQLIEDFKRFKFGEDGVVDGRDLARLVACYPGGSPWTAAPANPPSASPPPTGALLHLWDLNMDGVVNYQDQLILHSLLTVTLTPDADIDGNGVVNIEDVYLQQANLQTGSSRARDVNRDGVINAADAQALAQTARGAEGGAMRGGQR